MKKEKVWIRIFTVLEVDGEYIILINIELFFIFLVFYPLKYANIIPL